MTEPTHDPASAVVLLAEAWARRSPAERAAFARLAAMPGSRDPEDDSLRAVRERAALSGAVSPADLTRGLSQDAAARVLDVLAPEFDRVQAAGRWQWTLRSGPRQAALARLAAAGELAARVAEAAEIPTDQPGELLRRLAGIRSRHAIPGEVSAPDGNHAIAAQALAWARPLGGLASHLAEARRRAAVRFLSDGYATLTTHGVLGRAAELRALLAFAEGRDQSGQTTPFPFPVLPLTGAGGVGKSTVLGALIRPYLHRIEAGDLRAPAVVIIDFDQAIFRSASTLELSFEVTRQLGYAAPVAAADFSALRHQVRAARRGLVPDRDPGQGGPRVSSGFDSEAGVLARMHRLPDRPVLLVLDTFEAWQRDAASADRGRATREDPEGIVLEWIHRLGFDMGLGGLRVIVSGRAPLGARSGGLGLLTRPPLVIGDLQPGDARDLLTGLGLDTRDASALARTAGGNPLALQIAARSYRSLPEAARREAASGEAPAAVGIQVGTRGRALSRLREALRQVARQGFSPERPLCKTVADELSLTASAVATLPGSTFEVTISVVSPPWPLDVLKGVTLDLRIQPNLHFLASIDEQGRARFSGIPPAIWDIRSLGSPEVIPGRGFAMPSLEQTGALAASPVESLTREVHAPDGHTVFTVQAPPGEEATLEITVGAAATAEAPFLVPVTYETDTGQAQLLAAVARHQGRLYTAMELPGFNPYGAWSAGERVSPSSLAEWEPGVITASVHAARTYPSAAEFWKRIAEMAPPAAADAIRAAGL